MRAFQFVPTLQDSQTAKNAAYAAVGANCGVCAFSGTAFLSLIYAEPIFGLTPWSLADAGLFAVIAWKTYKMSRLWAVIGLVTYLGEVAYKIATHATMP